MTNPPASGKDTQLPKTGDTTDVALWMVLMVGAGILVLGMRKRKKEVKE
ncbi:MAG: LPXTG cell wall anchor domain-containing protein [Lachnospiraceae bacterium]